MFTSHKGVISTPKAIDFLKQRVRHGIYYVVLQESIKLWKVVNTFRLKHGVYFSCLHVD